MQLLFSPGVFSFPLIYRKSLACFSMVNLQYYMFCKNLGVNLLLLLTVVLYQHLTDILPKRLKMIQLPFIQKYKLIFMAGQLVHGPDFCIIANLYQSWAFILIVIFHHQFSIRYFLKTFCSSIIRNPFLNFLPEVMVPNYQ